MCGSQKLVVLMVVAGKFNAELEPPAMNVRLSGANFISRWLLTWLGRSTLSWSSLPWMCDSQDLNLPRDRC